MWHRGQTQKGRSFVPPRSSEPGHFGHARDESTITWDHPRTVASTERATTECASRNRHGAAGRTRSGFEADGNRAFMCRNTIDSQLSAESTDPFDERTDRGRRRASQPDGRLNPRRMSKTLGARTTAARTSAFRS